MKKTITSRNADVQLFPVRTYGDWEIVQYVDSARGGERARYRIYHVAGGSVAWNLTRAQAYKVARALADQAPPRPVEEDSLGQIRRMAEWGKAIARIRDAALADQA